MANLSVVRQAPHGDSWWAAWHSFVLALRAEHASEHTIAVYTEAARQFHAWQLEHQRPVDPAQVSREDVQAFLVELLAIRKPATVRSRFAALRRFFGWLVEEDDLDRSPFERLKAPKVPEAPPQTLSDDELRRLLKACEGKTFEQRRDASIVRLLIDTGLRRGELASLTVDGIDFQARLLRIDRRKGGNGGVVPMGARAARDLDRYLRVRSKHPQADDPRLWLGTRGPLSGDGVYQMVERRAQQAGVDRRIFVHLFRHSFADAFQRHGGSEADLQRLGGWRDPRMTRRYGAWAADQRAHEAHRKFSPGDRL